jgi:nicotinamide riboside transporter PnuC
MQNEKPSAISIRSALRWFCVLYVAYIAWASLHTLLAIHAEHEGPSHVAVLAAVELLAALLFLREKSDAWTGGLLLAVYAAAALLHLLQGELPAQLFYYAGTAVFIMFLRRRLPSTGPAYSK